MERAHRTDNLFSANLKILIWLAKVIFLGKVKTASELSAMSCWISCVPSRFFLYYHTFAHLRRSLFWKKDEFSAEQDLVSCAAVTRS